MRFGKLASFKRLKSGHDLILPYSRLTNAESQRFQSAPKPENRMHHFRPFNEQCALIWPAA
jgi:hypothetical protein